MTDYLTDSDVEVLNAARTILERARDAALSYEHGAIASDARARGYFAAHAYIASDAIFTVLNVGRAYLGLAISDDQVHNRLGESVRVLRQP